MGSNESAMEYLARMWQPYGGPSDFDIFVEFGITADEFYRRLASARRSRFHELEPERGGPNRRLRDRRGRRTDRDC